MADSLNADESPRHRVFISLGSNIDPAANLPAAVALLARFGRIAAVSSVYETLPVKFTAQANFLNAAVLLETSCTIDEVFDKVVPAVEKALGRVRDPANPNGPRTIDLDVALYDDLVLAVKRRELPDPDILRRAFVAIPLAELDPDYVHPTVGETLATLAGRFTIEAGDMQPRPDVTLRP